MLDLDNLVKSKVCVDIGRRVLKVRDEEVTLLLIRATEQVISLEAGSDVTAGAPVQYC